MFRSQPLLAAAASITLTFGTVTLQTSCEREKQLKTSLVNYVTNLLQTLPLSNNKVLEFEAENNDLNDLSIKEQPIF